MAAVMFLRKAMRYYRLWIYTCNAVLLVSVMVFLGVALGVAAHPYLSLVPGPPPYHPTLLYGYMAILLQSGIIQALGCVGALRLCQRMLSIYWLMLLFLLLGDVVVGLVWLYRFPNLADGLRTYARDKLHTQYGKDADITEAWDTLQQAARCCGVEGPEDYNATWWDVRQNHAELRLPASCCVTNYSRSAATSTRAPQVDQKPRHVPNYPRNSKDNTSKNTNSRHDTRGLNQRNLTCANASEDRQYLSRGCAQTLEKWLFTSAETLMILGFCVIAFIKLCFVGILRFEIQEMIQKIKILQGEAPCVPNPEIAAALGLVSPEKAAECGGLLSTGGGEGDGAGGGEGGGGEGRQEPESIAATPLTQPRLNHLPSHTDGAESDTNSHCALITDTPVRRPQPDKRKPNGNNNDVTELRELRHVRQTQI